MKEKLVQAWKNIQSQYDWKKERRKFFVNLLFVITLILLELVKK